MRARASARCTWSSNPITKVCPNLRATRSRARSITINVKGKEEYDLDWGGKLQFYNSIVGGAIDARFMPAILKGIMEKMDEGPLTGSYARDIRVVIYDGKMHPVDSNEISFKLAGAQRLQGGVPQCGPEDHGADIFSVEVLTPSEYMGAVMSDLQNRRAMIDGHGVGQGLRPPRRPRAAGRAVPLFDVALVAHVGGGDLYDAVSPPTNRCPPTCRPSCSKSTPTPTRSRPPQPFTTEEAPETDRAPLLSSAAAVRKRVTTPRPRRRSNRR